MEPTNGGDKMNNETSEPVSVPDAIETTCTPNTMNTETKSDEKESMEERYNKFRVYAVKLRNKVSDLTEQLRKSQAEKNQIEADREELQHKISQISDNAKKLQTIQSEYDKALDNLEQEKNENRKLTKHFETVVGETASLKESLHESKEAATRLRGEVERLTKEQQKSEAVLKQYQDTIKELKANMKADMVIREQKDKEYDEMKNLLNLEKEAHKATKAKMESIKQECTTKSVLSLEVHNYEKSVEDLKTKLDDELFKRMTTEKMVDKHSETISNLELQISELKDTCLSKANLLTVLGEKNEDIKQELCEVKREVIEKTKLVDQLNAELGSLNRDKGELLVKMEVLTTERDKIFAEMKLERNNYDEQIKNLESKIAALNTINDSRDQELESLRTEFLGYKLRAQSVLRTKQNQNNDSGKSIAEVEEELEHARTHAALLREKLDISITQIESLTREIEIVKEERNHAISSEKYSNEKILALHQELSSVTEQLRSNTNKIQQMERQHVEAIDALQILHKHNISELEAMYQRKLHNVQINEQKMTFTDSDNFATIPNVSDKSGENSSEHYPISRLSEMVLLEREEGEGSESVDSAPSVVVNSEKHYRHSLMPLDELLNSSDDYQYTTEPLAQTVDPHKLDVYEQRIRHLTVLLSDAERDIAKLTQLNQLLKEDIRRQQRSVEREQHANNFEYLKNIVFKFVTLKNGDERSHLIPVLNTILKLSPEETQKLNAVAGGLYFRINSKPTKIGFREKVDSRNTRME